MPLVVFAIKHGLNLKIEKIKLNIDDYQNMTFELFYILNLNNADSNKCSYVFFSSGIVSIRQTT